MDGPTNTADRSEQDPAIKSIVACKPLAEFTLFPRLPLELRLKIFKHVLPSSPIGHRLLRVTAEYTTQRPRIKNKGYLKFRLLDNNHNALVRDVRLLRVSTESRGVFLSIFKHHLHAGNGQKIPYADEDVVYIINFHKLVKTTPIFKPSRSHLLKELTMHNLALPFQMFYVEERSWGHQCPSMMWPSPPPVETPNKYVPILWLLRNLKVVAFVEWDFDNIEGRVRELVSRWVEQKGPQEPTEFLRKIMARSLLCIRQGWETAVKEGRQRPVLRSIGVEGDWDVMEAISE